MSTIAQLMAIGTNVQLVVTLADLKELFLEWQAEVEANKVKEKRKRTRLWKKQRQYSTVTVVVYGGGLNPVTLYL